MPIGFKVLNCFDIQPPNEAIEIADVFLRTQHNRLVLHPFSQNVLFAQFAVDIYTVYLGNYLQDCLE